MAHDSLAQIINEVTFGVMAVNEKGIVTMCNQQALSHLEIDQDILGVMDSHFANHLDRLPVLENILENCLSQAWKPFDLLAIPFSDKLLNIRGRLSDDRMIVLTIDDITQGHKQERSNIKALLQRQEHERHNLARDIHDGIGPLMSAILLHLDALKSELTGIPIKAMKKIDIICELMQEAADEIRNISHALIPGALVDLGLVAALENLCRKTNESERIRIEFYQSGLEQRLNIHLALGLYRIAQELLNNALKHSRATTINIQLIKHPSSVVLMVEDDGIGFEKKELLPKLKTGVGFRNIQTRIRALGGRFNIDTALGKGMLALVEIPLKN